MSGVSMCERIKPQLVAAKSYVMRIESHSSIHGRTENKKDWELLFESKYLDRCYAGVALFDKNFYLMNGNKAYDSILKKHTSYSLDELIGKSYLKIAPGSAGVAGRWFKTVMSEFKGEAIYNFEQKIPQQHNYIVSYYDAYLFPLTNDRYEPLGCAMCCIDVTENMIHKSSLLDEEQMLILGDEFVDGMASDMRVSAPINYTNYRDGNRYRRNYNMLHDNTHQYVDNVVQFRSGIYGKNVFARPDPISEKLDSLTRDLVDLTPTEAQVAEWVRLGKSSKEIAYILCVSKECIDFHRNNIRKKLGLTKSKINLNRYLNSILADK